MEQVNLFGGQEAPARPTQADKRQPLSQQDCGRFKRNNGIVTWKNHQSTAEPWTAYKAPPGHESESPAVIVSRMLDWLKDHKHIAFGDSQYEALTRLCDGLGIPMPMYLRKD